MTKNQKKARELYPQIEDKSKVSEEFLYNAICCFEISPDDVVELLNDMPAEECAKLSAAFRDCREHVKKVSKATLESGDFSEPFHSPEIEDILFYQISNGKEIG